MFEKEKRETPYRRKGGRAVLLLEGLAKEAGKGGRKRFLAALEMTAWGMGYPNDSVGSGYTDDSVGSEYPVQHTKNVWKSTHSVSSSRAKSRDLFRWR